MSLINYLNKDTTSKARKIFKQILRYRYVYLFILPGIIYYFIFMYIPMYGVTLAFKDFMFNKGIQGSPWVGFKHFYEIFNNQDFWDVTLNTIIISFGRLIFEFPAPIFIAIMLNELRFKWFKRSIQTVMYFPYFISWIVMYTLLLNVVSVETGLINTVLSGIGLNKINFMTEPGWFRPIVFLSSIWKNTGYTAILYLAAITSIPQDIYEAAIVDGANRFQKIWHITLPGMQNVMLTVLILCVGNMMNGGFDQIFNIYNPLVYEVGDIIDTYIYREGILRGLFGMTTAVGLFKSIINMILLLFVDRISRSLKGVGIYM